MSTFRQALEAAGLRPRDIVPDGRIRRCVTENNTRRKNGWYMLSLDGRKGVWGDNAVAPRQAIGHWDDATVTNYAPSPAEQERQRSIREQQRQYRIQAIRSARAFWNKARPCTRLHAYLERKGLSALGTVGLREHDGLLVVPVLWRGAVISVQTISVDGTKRFWPGAPVKGGYFEIQRQRPAVTVIVEGLATGLAVFQCVRNARVIVAYDAGNLLPVVQALQPTGSVVFAADNDIGTQARRGFNPGLDKARNAADLIGAGVAWPEGIDGSDWADALKQWGPTAMRRIERMVLGAVRYVEAPS